MKVLKKIRKTINAVLDFFCVLVFLFMVLTGIYQILVRYFFQNPSTVSEELLTYSFVWMALLASARVFGKREHLRMGFWADKLTGSLQKTAQLLGEVLVLGFAVSVQVWGGYRIMQLSMTQITASLGIPMGILYLILPFSGICTAIYSVLNILDLILQPGSGIGKGEAL